MNARVNKTEQNNRNCLRQGKARSQNVFFVHLPAGFTTRTYSWRIGIPGHIPGGQGHQDIFIEDRDTRTYSWRTGTPGHFTLRQAGIQGHITRTGIPWDTLLRQGYKGMSL